jgi:Ca2+-binding EF-hand superfamily protein
MYVYVPCSPEDVKNVMTEFDPDQNGLDFDEFTDLLRALKKLAKTQPKNRVTERFSEVQISNFRKTFTKYDVDKSGYLDAEEIQEVLKEQGKEVPMDQGSRSRH